MKLNNKNRKISPNDLIRSVSHTPFSNICVYIIEVTNSIILCDSNTYDIIFII